MNWTWGGMNCLIGRMIRVAVIALILASVIGGVAAFHEQTPVHHRSAAAKRAFRRLHPCPATGQVKGACPGYVIDHVKPLACGGADAPQNMQWQTTEDAKAKDAVERRNCGN